MGWPYQQKPPMGWPLDWDNPLSRGLVCHLPFNEGSGGIVNDLSGNGNTGTLVGAAHFGPGKFGSCLDFGGDGDYVDCGDDSSLDMGSGDLSVSAWFKTITTSNDVIIGKGMSGTDSKRYVLVVLGDSPYNGKVQIYLDDNSNPGSLISSADTYNDGNWHYVVGVRDGSNLRLYIDGTAETPVDISSLGDIDSAGDCDIGTIYDNALPGYANYFNGSMDNVMIFDRALTASEIAQLYREPFCMFKDPAEIALLGGYQEAPPAGIPILRRRRSA